MYEEVSNSSLALAAYGDAIQRRDRFEEGDEGYDEVIKEFLNRHFELNRIRFDALNSIAESDEDSFASFLALEMGGMFGKGDRALLARLDQLQSRLGEHPALMDMRSRARKSIRMRATSENLKQGLRLEDFSVPGTGRHPASLAGRARKQSLRARGFLGRMVWALPRRAPQSDRQLR